MAQQDNKSSASRRASVKRCPWVGDDPMMTEYHDREWGLPEHDGRALWENLMLDCFQAGLSWRTILYKRQALRDAFAGLVPGIVARFGPADVQRLMKDSSIIRSRAKIEAIIGNARAYVAMADAGEDFATFVWRLAGGKPIVNAWKAGEIPARTPLSETISDALKKRGFKFVGPVIVYAWMQGSGIVNDHVVGCFRHKQVGR